MGRCTHELNRNLEFLSTPGFLSVHWPCPEAHIDVTPSPPIRQCRTTFPYIWIERSPFLITISQNNIIQLPKLESNKMNVPSFNAREKGLENEYIRKREYVFLSSFRLPSI